MLFNYKFIDTIFYNLINILYVILAYFEDILNEYISEIFFLAF